MNVDILVKINAETNSAGYIAFIAIVGVIGFPVNGKAIIKSSGAGHRDIDLRAYQEIKTAHHTEIGQQWNIDIIVTLG